MNEATWRWRILRAGGLRLDGGGMFGIIPKAMWSTWMKPDDENRIGLATNCLLLEHGSRRVLVETGCGDKWTDRERAMYGLESRTVVDALLEHDVDPDSIDTVITTHLHFDHAGGLTTWDGADAAEMAAAGRSPRPVFRNAEVVVQRREWEDAIANRSTMTRTYLRTHLDPIADRIRLIDGDDEILPGIRVEPLLGHTWGMQGVFIDTPDGRLVFPGDLIPTVHHVHPSASLAYDMLPYESMRTKLDFLPRAADDRWTLVLDHEPDQPVIRITGGERNRFMIEPVS